MTNKSAAALPLTRLSPLAAETAASTTQRIAPADFGERLRRGREQKALDLREIANATKIGMSQLRALERGDLNRLPAGIYRRAIVRQYAAAVGLDVEQTLRDFASVCKELDVDLQRLEEFADRRGDARSSSFTTALVWSAAALVVLGAVAAVATSWYRAGTTISAVDASVAGTSTSTPKADAPAIAAVATTQTLRANAGDIEGATEPAVLQTGTGGIADGDATEGELRITSEPAGAQVTVNGIGWGVTPMTIKYMPFGKKVIRATKPGYMGAQRDLDFVPDHRIRSVRIQLSPDAAATP